METAGTIAGEAASQGPDKIALVQSFIMHHMQDSHTLPWGQASLPSWLSLHGVMVLFGTALILFLFAVVYRRKDEVPTGWTNFLELFVVFIRDHICIPFLGQEDGRRMAPLFISFFFFILTLNLLGLVPSLYAATANINVTGALAAVTFVFMVFGALYRLGPVGFIKSFIPEGIPIPILIVLVPIEIISVVVRCAALMIRLFANELAGHMVIFSMLGLLLIFGVYALPVMVMAVGIYIMEVGIAFMQAYIFTLLSAMFIGQRYHPSH